MVQAPSGLADTPRMWTCRVAASITDSTCSGFREIVSTWEEVAGQQPVRRSAQERPAGGARFPRGRPVPPGAQDPPPGRVAAVVPGPGQLAVHLAVPAGRVLPCQPQHQVADLLAGCRAAWPA